MIFPYSLVFHNIFLVDRNSYSSRGIVHAAAALSSLTISTSYKLYSGFVLTILK